MMRLLSRLGLLVGGFALLHVVVVPIVDPHLPAEGYTFWWLSAYALPMLAGFALVRLRDDYAYYVEWIGLSVGAFMILYTGAIVLSRGAQLRYTPLSEAFAPTNNFSLFAGVSALSAYLLFRGLQGTRPRTVGRRGYRGRGRATRDEAAAQIAAALPKTFLPGVVFGSLRLPDSISPTHFYVTGAPGSGKTLTVKLLLAAAVDAMNERPGQRVLVYDPKRELFPFLAALTKKPIAILNPFDERSVPWAIAHDIGTPAAAHQLASLLIPDGDGARSDPYWTDAPRHLLSGAVIALQKSVGQAWRLRDLLLAARDPDTLRSLLSRTEQTKDRLQHFGIERTTQSLFSALANQLQRYEVVASIWDYAESALGRQPVSLADWLRAESVLVLGNDPEHSRSLAPLNRLLVERLSDLIRSLPEASSSATSVVGLGRVEPRTWVVIDEAVTVGKLPGLKELMAEGRSKGACLVLGFQDIHDLYEVYGENGANGILGQAANKVVLRLENGASAEIMARQFQRREVVETSTGMTYTKDGSQSSWNDRLAEEQIVLPKELLDLPRPGPGPIVGFYKTALSDPFGASIPFDAVLKLAGVHSRDPAFVPMPAFAQEIRPWDEADRRRLGLAGGAKEGGASIFDSIGQRGPR